ncbi:zinc finger protein 700-like [Culicoides brevitarsis]|uniref:zinc finger protein 700-like n=1 Tax=Culicoides brevitarsis TaxID=469753 RepID=UPI00307C6E8D
MCGLSNTETCRSCRSELLPSKSLQLDGKYKTLSGNSKYLSEIFWECTGVGVTNESNALCSKCASILIASYEFKQMAQMSEKARNGQKPLKKVKKVKYLRRARNTWKAHRCPAFGCNLIFRYNADLLEHLKNSQKSPNHNFRCDICDKFYSTKDGIRAHLQQFHKDYKCSRCNEILHGRHHLYAHRRKLHDAKVAVICAKCGKSFTNNEVLRRHVRGVHDKKLDYECNVCGRRCLTSSNLKCHSLIHAAPGKYDCDVCGKSFKLMVNLKLHQKTHRSVKAPQESDVIKPLNVKENSTWKKHETTLSPKNSFGDFGTRLERRLYLQ